MHLIGTSGADNLTADAGDDTLQGLEGNDVLRGMAGADMLEGGLGADTMIGSEGADVYVFTSGDGSDRVDDLGYLTAATDVLKFTNVNAGGVTLTQSGESLLVIIDGTSEVITVAYQYSTASGGNYGLEQIQFADGTTWSEGQVFLLVATGATQLPGAPLLGGGGADSLSGTSVAEFIYGDAGSDTLAGLDGADALRGAADNDLLEGGAGNDRLEGESGADTLIGGLGADTMIGSEGADVYVFTSGDGSDRLDDLGYLTAATDVLKFTDINAGGVTLTQSGESLIVTIDGTSEVITVAYQYSTASGGNYGLEQIQFADGTAWTEAQFAMLVSTGGTQLPGAPVFGGSGADSLAGTAVGEFMYGDLGNDTLAGGDGNDFLRGGADNDLLEGGTGNDRLEGESGADTLTGGLGADTMVGSEGADVYVFTSGDGSDRLDDLGYVSVATDVLKFTNVNPGGVTLTQSGDNLVVTIDATGEVITVNLQYSAASGGNYGLEQIQFADGTVWTEAQFVMLVSAGATQLPGAPILGDVGADSLPGTSVAEFIYGDAGNDTLTGLDGADILRGGADNDVLEGGVGNDRLEGESGADTLTGGVGADTMTGGEGADVYVFTSGDGSDRLDDLGYVSVATDVLKFTNVNPDGVTLTQSAEALIVTIDATGEVITVNYQYSPASGGNYGLEQIQFADGTVWTEAQFVMLVAAGATQLPGAPILGGAGAESLAGTSVAEFIYGDAGNDTLAGLDGNDILRGGADNDVLEGGVGNDRLEGESGADTLTGGLGADTMIGSEGADVYVFTSGDGSERVDDLGYISVATDVLKLTNVNPDGVTLTQSGESLIVTIDATGEVITVAYQYSSASGGNYGLEQIQFADGTIWTEAQFVLLVAAGATQLPGAPILGGSGADSLLGTSVAEFIYGDVGNDTLAGLDGNDVLRGAADNDLLEGGVGNDRLEGESGADTLTGGVGADTLIGSEGADVYVFTSGDGSDRVDDLGYISVATDVLKLTNVNPDGVTLTQSGESLIVTIDATGEVITVAYQYSSASGGNYGLEQIQFADGTIWTEGQFLMLVAAGATQLPGAPILGGAGADSLSGTSLTEFIFGDAGADTIAAGDGADVLRGGADNDLLDGGSGNDRLEAESGADTLTGGLGADTMIGSEGGDVYVFTSGDGSDRVDDLGYISVATDILKLTNVNPDGVTLTQSGESLLVTIDATGEVITVAYQYSTASGGNYGLEQIQFADGTIWSEPQFVLLVSAGATQMPGAPVLGSGSADSLSGTSVAEFMFGDAGNDTLAAGDGADVLRGWTDNDLLEGGAGNDRLEGESGSDTLAGGLGADTMIGSEGADIYVFTSGDGSDRLDDLGYLSAATDVLKLTDLDPDDVTMTRSGESLIVTVDATGEVITVAYQFSTASGGNNYGLEQIQFADSSIWYRGQPLDGWI